MGCSRRRSRGSFRLAFGSRLAPCISSCLSVFASCARRCSCSRQGVACSCLTARRWSPRKWPRARVGAMCTRMWCSSSRRSRGRGTPKSGAAVNSIYADPAVTNARWTQIREEIMERVALMDDGQSALGGPVTPTKSAVRLAREFLPKEDNPRTQSGSGGGSSGQSGNYGGPRGEGRLTVKRHKGGDRNTKRKHGERFVHLSEGRAEGAPDKWRVLPLRGGRTPRPRRHASSQGGRP